MYVQKMRERGGRQRDSLTLSLVSETDSKRNERRSARIHTQAFGPVCAPHVCARVVAEAPTKSALLWTTGRIFAVGPPGNNQQNPHHYLVGRPASLVGWANTRGADDPCANSALNPFALCKQVLLSSGLPSTDGSLDLSAYFHVCNQVRGVFG